MIRGVGLASRLAPLALACGLAACSGPRTLPGDDAPTLASLPELRPRLERDTPEPAPPDAQAQAIDAYRRFLEVAPPGVQRAEAMRRLGDLEMDEADRRAAAADPGGGAEAPDYREAIARYETFLKEYPQDPRNDRVLYQLARAQEQHGQLEAALGTLTRLVAEHPGSMYLDEAQFRRGESLFALRDYAQAEGAYAAVLRSDNPTPYQERARYMLGWSLFKQGRLQASIEPLMAVLDGKLGALPPRPRDEADLAAIPQLTRADRELVEDSFRVISLALSQLDGAESIPAHTASRLREGYQFRLYQQLAELYLRQGRAQDAAETLARFVKRDPLHPQAPLMQARVVAIYADQGFETLALAAKQEHVQAYGSNSALRQRNPTAWTDAQPLVKTHLADLARHHHAQAQKTHADADLQQALRWYREGLRADLPAEEAARQRFLLAELLFENGRFAEAVPEYETVAYAAAPRPPQAADAGYAALLCHAALAKAATDPRPQQQQAVAGALRFAAAFPADPRSAAVLADAADQLLAMGEGERARAVARQTLALQPPPAAEPRRVAWTVIAHQAFARSAFVEAEQAYAEVLALAPDSAPRRNEWAERHAAAIYQQGEIARTGGRLREAVEQFTRIGALVTLPAGSALRPTAMFDAAAALIALKDWLAAAAALENFRRQYPTHALQADVPPQLALAYLQLGQPARAAAEFERVAAAATDPALARSALWQAAELHDRAAASAGPADPAQRALATKAWERYLQQYPRPLEPAVQARWQLAGLARREGPPERATPWLQAVVQADRQAGDERSPLTRSLGGQAALMLAEPALQAYRKVALVEPLQPQLKLKKARLQDLLKAYAEAAEVGVAEVTTAATFASASAYQDFGQALLQSQRPRKLNKAELEQYNVMLEEQAFPFEEKAIELFEANARRTQSGLYDRWVRESFAQLARLKPARYAKTERDAPAESTDPAALQAALRQSPGQGALLNQLGVALRRQGQFEAARRAYEQAIAADPQAVAPQLNLAILLDLYLVDAARAQALYQRCAELSPADAGQIGKWLAELRTRKPVPTTTGSGTGIRPQTPGSEAKPS